MPIDSTQLTNMLNSLELTINGYHLRAKIVKVERNSSLLENDRDASYFLQNNQLTI